MKCSKCGKEIANDSRFCEYCGSKVVAPQSKKLLWIALAVILSLCMIGGVIGIASNSKNVQDSGVMTDAQQMNIHGSIKKITETSYYTIEADELKDQRIEDGGFFDDCAFLAIVYGGEHLARVNFRNFFLQQVSDCVMLFNKDGNLYDLTSLNSDGAHVLMYYNGESLIQQMDVLERMNDEKEITDFVYEYEDNNVVRELQTQRTSCEDRGTLNVVNYIYTADRLVKAKTDADYYYVDYLSNGRIGTIHLPKFDHGQDLIINIEYDSNNNIASVDLDKGTYGKTHTEFTYQYYDPRGNWFQRNAIGTIERNDQTIPFSIRTVREYEYY